MKYLSCLLTGLEMKVHLVPLTQPHWPQLPLLQKQVRSPLPTVLGLSQPLPLSRSSAAAVRGLRTTWQAGTTAAASGQQRCGQRVLGVYVTAGGLLAKAGHTRH